MPDATNPPPVSERPRCPNCDKPLQPAMTWESRRVLDAAGFTLRRMNYRWTGNYSAYGAFCTLRCCESFANAAYRAGYRIVRNPGA